MQARWPRRLVNWLKTWLSPKAAPTSDILQARQLIAAIDRGGVPLNPAKINAIARNLGLEVSRQAPMDETIARIRQAIARST